MNLVLGLLMLGGSATAVWAGITDPEGGVWAGVRNVFQSTPNSKHVSATSAGFISDLVNLTGSTGATTAAPAVAPAVAPAGGGAGLHTVANIGTGSTTTYSAGGITYTANADGSFSPEAVAAGAPTGTTAAGGGTRAAIIADARSWLGVPYRWAGTTRAGVDCSGLVQRVYGAHGIALPRVAAAQATKGHRVRLASAQPGDLVFFGTPAHHVGIILGGGKMLHAPKPGGRVRVEAIAGAVPGSAPYARNVIG